MRCVPAGGFCEGEAVHAREGERMKGREGERMKSREGERMKRREGEDAKDAVIEPSIIRPCVILVRRTCDTAGKAGTDELRDNS